MMAVNEGRKGYEKTKLGLIPKDWEIKKLGNFGEFSKGKGILKNDLIQTGIPCIRYGEIYTRHDYIIKRFYSFISSETAEESKRIKKNDILFAGSGETLEDIGKSVAFIGDEEAYAGGDVVILRPIKINSVFLAYALNNEYVIKQRYRIGQGHSVVHIYSKDLKNLLILNPPLPEQKKIAEILTKWDKAIELTETLIQAKTRRKKGLMQQLLTGKKRFGEFVERKGFKKTKLGLIPKDWKIIDLESASDFITKGSTPTTYGFKWEKNGILFLRSECVGEQGLYLKPAMFISDEANAFLNRSEVQSGDILMTITGNLGRVVLLPFEFKKGNINQHIARIRVNNKNALHYFVFQYLSQEKYRKEYYKINTGQAYPQISLKQVRESSIPLPPLPEQKKIAAVLFAADKEIELLNQKLEALKSQKKGLMQKLLTGQIRVKTKKGAA